MRTKQVPQLTIVKATQQARNHVSRIMPSTMVSIESKLSHDLATDTPLVITTVWFLTTPTGDMPTLVSKLAGLPGQPAAPLAEPDRIVITRKR